MKTHANDDLSGKKKHIAKKMSGKASLNKPKGERNMGENMMLGKDEHNRA